MATATIIQKSATLYFAWAPDAGVFSYGGCFEEAVNSLTEELKARALPLTGEERKSGHEQG
jgi:hypothetical protein